MVEKERGEGPGREQEVSALVEAAVKGDAESFGRLYDIYGERIYRHIYYRVGDPTDAEDLTAQVFLNAWRAISRYRSMGRPFIVWLLSIARNLVVDHYRARKEHTSLDGVVVVAGERDDPQAEVERTLTGQGLREAILKLKKDQQMVIVLRFIDDLEYPDIAAIMGKSEGAIRVIQHRALIALRSILKKEEGGE